MTETRVNDALDMLNIFADTIRSTVSELEKQIANKEDGEIKRTFEVFMDMEISRIYVIEEIIRKLESDE
ncbi:hypothetical protein [Nitrosarchaeum koreense]|uniref:Uncharacterized protein n=1 Tax=Nitrosarchaeum koreense MY1 TaxID=1001994 RepID=F9CWE6_9ARCH|nr:hypothetical protein [Nitrosarchaeum koreense]EGP93598.1 hypothetical protein MY1_0836 [Nitrosarchaeum koreense MY1]